MAFLSLLSLVQSLVVWVGLAAGLVYCVWGSSRGRVSVGDTVLFISMMQQLYVPLTFFGSYYRQVRGSWAWICSAQPPGIPCDSLAANGGLCEQSLVT